MFHVLPDPDVKSYTFFIASALTMMLGSIPQQDVFQRVMSANNEYSATRGPIIGGVCYIVFAFVPMFLVLSALIIMPEQAELLMDQDPQKVLPTLVMEKMPFVMQVLFFGALLSAIKSCASATLLAPSVTFTENIWRHIRARAGHHNDLRAMRVTVLVFSVLVLLYSIAMQGTPIYDLVSGAYQIPLVGAFTPLVFGLYWKRASTQGALFAIVLGVTSWLLFVLTPAGEYFPAQLLGLLASVVGMVVGSLGPQTIKNVRGAHTRWVGSN
jgi:Na+/proline symporter